MKTEAAAAAADNGSRIRSLTSELGTTGLEYYGGKIEEEFLTMLQGEKQFKTYKEMSENDSVIASMLFAIEMLIRSVSWDVEPISEDKEDQERAEWLKSCIDDMDLPFVEVISEILTMLIYGFSIHEEVYKIRRGPNAETPSNYDDGKIGWRRLPIRGQDTIDQWNLTDGGDVESIVQVAPPKYNSVLIPSNKFILFRTTARKGNPQGRSVLRGAYQAWYFKKKISLFEAIGVERDVAGLPICMVPPRIMRDDASAADKAIYDYVKQLVRNIRNDSQVGVVFPQEYDENGKALYEFKLLSAAGTKQFNTNEIINRYDARIASTVLADFILLGQQQVGSFALASSKTELFAIAIGAWMNSISDTFNRVAIPRLFYANGYTGPMPKLIHGDIEERDLKDVSAYVLTLANAGALTVPDEKLERHLRRIGGLPEQDKH